MGCVQSKASTSSVPAILPTSVKVSNSTKTAVAPGNPGQPSQVGDPIYLDRADTLVPQDTSTSFQIQAGGNAGLQEYVDDVKASNRSNGKPPISSAKFGPASRSSTASFAANSLTSPPDLQLTLAESLPSELSLAQAQAQRISLESQPQRISLEDNPRGGRVTLPPLAQGTASRKDAASVSGVNVQVVDRSEVQMRSSGSFSQQQLNSLPGSTGAPSEPARPSPDSPAELGSGSSSQLQPQPSAGSKSFKQMNAGKPKVTKRAQFGSMYMGGGGHNSINRPTYAQDAVDEDNADAKMSGIFSAREQAVASPGPQRRYEAFSSMVFAQGGVPMQHVTANDMPSPDTDVQRNDLAPDASLDLSEGGQDMGSLTGWQALANEVMMEAEEEAEEGAEAEAEDGLSRGQSRDMGSLTGWQALANEVMAELGSGSLATNPAPEESEEPLQAWNNGTFKMDASQAAVKPVGVARPAAGAKLAAVVKEASWASNAAAPNTKKGGTFYIQYETLEELGEGAFGKAMKCRRRRDNQVFVVKIMHESKMSAKAIEEAKNEVKVLNSLNHPNIVKYYECYQERNMMHIIMEFCQEGDLDSAIKKYKGYLPEEDIMLKFVQIALALHYTHSKGIIHRDLKANNIFCSAHGIVKLGDFGISKALGDNQNVARTMVGTPYYMSPEILKGKPYDGKTDVWAIGCVLYEMCALKKAFDASNLGAITVKVMSGKFPPIPAHYSSDLKELVEALIKKEPEARPSLQEILDLGYVRRHMQAYRDHISRHITERQTSFQRSLSQFNLESIAQEAAVSPEAALQALADGQAASLAQLQDNLFGPGAAGRDGGPTAGPSGMDLPRAPGGGGRARRKSGIIMSELGANLKPLAPSAATAAAEAARAAAERRGVEAAARQAHRQDMRRQEEAQALTNLRAFKDSIKAAVSRVGSTPLVAPSASSASSNSGTSTTLVTPIASATGSATAARRSRFGGRSQSVENITALDAAADAAAQNVRGNRFSMFNAAALRGNKEETADDEDASPADRTDSLAQLQQKVPNLMAQMNGIAQNPTTSQI